MIPNAMCASVALGLPPKAVEAGKTTAMVVDIVISMRHGRRTLRALVDSGAHENCISQRVIVEEGLKALPSSMGAHAVDGHPIRVYGRHILETHATDMRGATRSFEQKYIATDILRYDVLLGYPWLSQFNPRMDWPTGAFYYQATRVVESTEVNMAEILDPDEGELMIAFAIPSPQLSAYPPSGGVARAALVGSIVPDVVLPPEYGSFADVFSEDGANQFPEDTKVRHSIEIQEGKTVPYGPIYPLSEHELRVLRDYLDTSMAKGWIRKSESPAGAPILFVKKKDGSLRLCVDYRGLNNITVKNRHPLPLISETLDRLVGAAVYTKLDLRDAYHRIRIAEKDVWKTAFRTRYGHFEYMVMPFGLTNAPATFQSYINEALKGLLDVICVAYMDDILIFSRNREEHAGHVRLVLERLRLYNLYIKLSKCDFSVEKVEFLGFIVSVAGVSMDPRRIQAIMEWPVPTSYRDIQVFLGFVNFYRGFIKEYSAVVVPITDLLIGMQKGRKQGPFVWPDSAATAFSRLKACFTEAGFLRHFDPKRQNRVETDASTKAVAGTLTQAYVSPTNPKRIIWYPVAFYSKKMSKEEQNYSTGDQEMLAIVRAFEVWRHYLDTPATTTLVLTDHEALQSFMTTKPLHKGRQVRWAETLAAFDFVIQYRKGKENPADGLSRRPDHMRVASDEQEENPLLDLLRARTPAALAHADHMLHDSVGLSVLTRGMAKKPLDPHKSLFNTLPKPGEEAVAGAQEEHAQPVEDASVSGEGEPDPAGPSRNRELRAFPDSLTNLFLHLQTQDAWCTRRAWESHPEGLAEEGEYKGRWHTDPAGLVRRDGAVYVPSDPAVRAEIVRVHHDDPWQGGHFGNRRTLEAITRHYWWPNIAKRVREYCASCDVCQRMKVPRHKPYGLLSPLPQPENPWKDITLDFIVGLPPSIRRGVVYDAILVVVCRYSKMVKFIPCNGTVDAEELANLLIDVCFSQFGTPRSIVSDRGSTFTSKYWGTLCHHLAIKRCFSTAFHPQTDGQTERMNQTLECYLRCYINHEQDDWSTLLASAEYASNNAVNATTKRTPFELVLNFTPTMGAEIAPKERESESRVGKDKAEALLRSQESSKVAWEEAQRATSTYYNKKHKEMSFNEGDLVLVAAKHIRTLRASKKLADRFLGPFKVLKRIGQNAYRLQLPQKYGRLHPTFHVSLLQAYRRREGCETPEPIDIEGEEYWEVERVLDERRTKAGTKFLVRWKGFSEAEDSWEPAGNFRDCKEAIREFREFTKGKEK
jgi:Reverse transcriptase (RNA-dependent DNA polymerase)/RNase H-like domain found in reverse transcriptase/Integrase zinc binding domain/Chromo (CHRromatin Organisation MOdifier) domain/Integrase core domain